MRRILNFIFILISFEAFSQPSLSIIIDTINSIQIFKSSSVNSEAIGNLELFEIVEIISVNDDFIEIIRYDGSKGFIQNTTIDSYDNFSWEEKKGIVYRVVSDYIKLLEKQDSNCPNKPLIETEEQIQRFINYRINPLLPTIEYLICIQNDFDLLVQFSYYIVNNSTEYENQEILLSFANCYFCQTVKVKGIIEKSGFLMDKIFIRHLNSVINNKSTDFLGYPDFKRKKKEFNKWISKYKIAEPQYKITKGSFPLE